MISSFVYEGLRAYFFGLLFLFTFLSKAFDLGFDLTGDIFLLFLFLLVSLLFPFSTYLSSEDDDDEPLDTSLFCLLS